MDLGSRFLIEEVEMFLKNRFSPIFAGDFIVFIEEIEKKKRFLDLETERI